MGRYQARDIMKMSKEAIWAMPDERFTLVFDDGEIETDTPATVYSWYCAVFHRLYPESPLTKLHHIGASRLGKSTTAELLENGLFSAYDHAVEKGQQFAMDHAKQVVCDTIFDIHKDFTSRLGDYVTSVSILDFVEVVEHPIIKAANDSVAPTQNSIDHTYSTVRKVLLDPQQLLGNPVAKAAKSGLVSMGQILQCVSVRGYLTDIDSRIFLTPILKGYVHGITHFYDALIESRSASKALSNAKDPVADSEYFNRKMQLGCATLKNIHYMDCGSQNTIEVKVTAANFDSLEGKYYLTPAGVNPYAPIRRRDRSVIGTTIQMRSVLKCQHPDPYGVCSTCLGELAISIPRGTCLGHVSATSLCEAVSQNVLSTKHLDGSSSVDMFIISDHDQYYIRSGSAVNELKLATELADADEIRMIVKYECAPSLADINRVRSVDSLPAERISELAELTLEIKRGENTEYVTVPVSMGSRYSYFTTAALRYIKTVGWESMARGDYVIDLKQWDFEIPLFELPMRHTNMVEYMTAIENFIKASPNQNKNKNRRSNSKNSRAYNTTDEALFAFYDLINSKLNVNIAHLENILLSTMVSDTDNRDHRIPVNRSEGTVGYYEDNMMFRSLSAAMAYEKQGGVLADIRTCLVQQRPDHPLDALLVGHIPN